MRGNIRPRFSTFRSTRSVRRPPPPPDATEALTQYPETYVVSRDPARYSKRLLAAVIDVADAPEIDRNMKIFKDQRWSRFQRKPFENWIPGKNGSPVEVYSKQDHAAKYPTTI